MVQEVVGRPHQAKQEQHPWYKPENFANMRRLNWLAPVFEGLIDRHGTAPDERSAMEYAVFSKMIDHRNAVKRGKISDEDQSRLAAKINTYAERVRVKRSAS